MLNPDHDSYSQTKINDIKYEDVKEDDIFTNNHGDNEEEEEEEEEFSFMCGADNSPIAAEDAFFNGQIKPIYPLFDTSLTISDNVKPPVKKVFVETNDEVVGPYCEWSGRSNKSVVEVETASSGVCKKSNSTGFSKIWRFKDLMGRSSSDGKDAFVFLNNSHHPTAAVKGDKDPTVKRESKTKTTPSPHEVYLRSKAKEDEQRRRSYLPYKPELVGFFTNVHGGGLTKNVHPY